MPAQQSDRFILLLCGLLAATTGTAVAERPPIRSYTTADGLASDTVYRVVPTREASSGWA